MTKNGNETDVDCGGSCQSACKDGYGCGVGADCKSSVCVQGKCAAPTCTDKVKNGAETDVDCGGDQCTTSCGVGQKCLLGTDCSSGACDSVGSTCSCPSGMAIVPKIGGGSYCADQTEVTYKAYEVFYRANPNIVEDQTLCGSWNRDFTPGGTWPPTSDMLAKPVAYVNWCDAAAYCTWSKKHLCRSIAGPSNDFLQLADAHKSEWFNACSAQGKHVYPYGNGTTYDPQQCDGADNLQFAGGPADVVDTSGAPISACVGGEPDLYQMSGNVAEWEDSCDAMTGMTDNCRVRGGSYLSAESDLACGAAASAARNAQLATIGFRCCQ